MTNPRDSLPWIPYSCTWELTRRCNLRCGHCGSAAGEARSGEMSRESALIVVRELAELGCRKVTLSGGEPTLCSHWPDVVAEGTRRGMHMAMIVNGSRHDRGFVRRARAAGLATLGVSIDGVATTHDRIRGLPGLHAMVLRLIRDCGDEGIPVAAVTTLWRPNAGELVRIHDQLVGRVFAWQLQLGVAMGNLRHSDQIQPTELLDLVPRIAALAERGDLRIDVGDNIGYESPYDGVLQRRPGAPPRWLGCYAGCQHVGIEADGGVKGCLSLQCTSRIEGNLQRESLAEIWSRPDAFSHNRSFDPKGLRGFCATCEHADLCRGGCLSMRTAGGGENRFCYHRVATLAGQSQPAVPRRSLASFVCGPAALAALIGLGGCATYGAPCSASCHPDGHLPSRDAIDTSDTSGDDRDGAALDGIDGPGGDSG